MKKLITIISLYRAGSGGCVVPIGPSQEWFNYMKLVSQANYGEVQVIVSAPSIEGYNGYPGCRLVFLPGNKDGIIQNVSGQGDVEVSSPLPENLDFLAADYFSGDLCLEFGFKELCDLHQALGEILEYNKKINLKND
ncbi:MAG: hypothetical protein Q8Q23_01305 [bacterium]|nr:hypothetical protein [bacterium]